MFVSTFMHERTLKTVLFQKKILLIEIVRDKSSQFSYTNVMNMKLLAVVTTTYINHGCSTMKTFWEENFTLVNMKTCVRQNVSKHRDIKDGKKYTIMDIYLNFGSLENMKITS